MQFNENSWFYPPIYAEWLALKDQTKLWVSSQQDNFKHVPYSIVSNKVPDALQT